MSDSTVRAFPAQDDFHVLPQPANEEWRPVIGYETDYAVSNLGRVKRLKESATRRRYPVGMILKATKQKNGYTIIRLVAADGKKKALYVHRVVTFAFMGECPHKHEVNHINSKRDDNRLVNLEYVTRSGNNLHAYQTNNRQAAPTYGAKHHAWKITDDQVKEIRTLHNEGYSYAALGRLYSVHWTSIRSVVARQTHAYVA